MPSLTLKPSHTSVRTYYQALDQFGNLGFDNEGNIRGAFEDLLKRCASQFNWTVVPEYQMAGSDKRRISVDACLIDEFHLPRGYWEAKDSKDDLDAEIQKKFAAGYPRNNILFQDPTRAVLVQNGVIANPRGEDQDITQPEILVRVLERFYDWQDSAPQEWDRAVNKFSADIPRIAQGVMELIEEEKSSNRLFRERFASFVELCRNSINPELIDKAVEEMLVQHLLTERIFSRIFRNSDFRHRNIIAAEIEEVIRSLTSRHFSRDAFLKALDPYYLAIEKAADSTATYAEKQHFLNHVYEHFFRAVSKKQADTHGIVYTPQPIVDFMVRSVEEVLKQEFGRSLADKGVHILDPFTGTGNFITNIMQEIPATKLQKKYETELHCNEVMLLPYYIASMNIEHAYFEKVGEYCSFKGVCLADTFALSERRQAGLAFMNEANTERVNEQKAATIFVVLGNPPYNASQAVAGDDNPNQVHKAMHERVWDTYAAASDATLLSTLDDPYIQAFRWATDRLRDEDGLVAYVSNGRFASGKATDGMRKCLAQEFDKIYLIDLGGDVRSNPQIAGTTHNVFGVQAGIAITILVRTRNSGNLISPAQIRVIRTPLLARKAAKFELLEQLALQNNEWETIRPAKDGSWRLDQDPHSWSDLLRVADKSDKAKPISASESVFHLFSAGCKSNRDRWCFNFSAKVVEKNIRTSIDFYNQAVSALPNRKIKRAELVRLVPKDEKRIAWSNDLRASLLRREKASFGGDRIRASAARPFTSQWLYFDRLFDDRVLLNPKFFGSGSDIAENVAIGITSHAQVPFSSLAVKSVPSHDFGGRPTQFLPFFVYVKKDRRENITDWALNGFRQRYSDEHITKWDIFYYTYAVFHHPEYRTRYAANLKRELPRIPFAPEFRLYAALGKELLELHIHYEQQPEYPLERIETGKLNWRVEKMKLSKDKKTLRYNGFLTLRGIPSEVFEYKLGNRSALDWIIQQYQISEDSRSGIASDPNRQSDPEYIFRLVGQVIQISVETVRRTRQLATLVLLDTL